MTAYNHVVVDIDSGIYSSLSKSILGVSDVVIIPVTHNTYRGVIKIQMGQTNFFSLR